MESFSSADLSRCELITKLTTPMIPPITVAISGELQSCVVALTAKTIISDANNERVVDDVNDRQGNPPRFLEKKNITRANDTKLEIDEAAAKPICPRLTEKGTSDVINCCAVNSSLVNPSLSFARPIGPIRSREVVRFANSAANPIKLGVRVSRLAINALTSIEWQLADQSPKLRACKASAVFTLDSALKAPRSKSSSVIGNARAQIPQAIGIIKKLVKRREFAMFRVNAELSDAADALLSAGNNTDAKATEKMPIGN